MYHTICVRSLCAAYIHIILLLLYEATIAAACECDFRNGNGRLSQWFLKIFIYAFRRPQTRDETAARGNNNCGLPRGKIVNSL